MSTSSAKYSTFDSLGENRPGQTGKSNVSRASAAIGVLGVLLLSVGLVVHHNGYISAGEVLSNRVNAETNDPVAQEEAHHEGDPPPAPIGISEDEHAALLEDEHAAFGDGEKCPCVPGHYCDGGTCEQCPDGEVSLEGATSCAKPLMELCVTGTENPSCKNGGKCTDEDGTQPFSCSCGCTGFNGDRCENDIDECATETQHPNGWLENPVCANGGKCANKDGTFSCRCVRGFKGEHCEIEPTYVIDVWGDDANSCPPHSRSERIYSEATCKAAAKDLGLGYPSAGPFSLNKFPLGCYRDGNNLYFNLQPKKVYRWMKGMVSICDDDPTLCVCGKESTNCDTDASSVCKRTEDCVDTTGGAVDKRGYGCDGDPEKFIYAYRSATWHCGNYDIEDSEDYFKSDEMCCGCGGGAVSDVCPPLMTSTEDGGCRKCTDQDRITRFRDGLTLKYPECAMHICPRPGMIYQESPQEEGGCRDCTAEERSAQIDCEWCDGGKEYGKEPKYPECGTCPRPGMILQKDGECRDCTAEDQKAISEDGVRPEYPACAVCRL